MLLSWNSVAYKSLAESHLWLTVIFIAFQLLKTDMFLYGTRTCIPTLWHKGLTAILHWNLSWSVAPWFSFFSYCKTEPKLEIICSFYRRDTLPVTRPMLKKRAHITCICITCIQSWWMTNPRICKQGGKAWILVAKSPVSLGPSSSSYACILEFGTRFLCTW